MILLQLRANFGKLHGTLTLHEGLNELCLPNEAGKSTWSAFLLAMLYGIDTRERATRENQNLPAKERYRPWDGSSMEGAIDLIWKLAEESSLNLLWEVEVVCATRVGDYVTVICNADIEQTNGDPDKTLW